MQNKINKIVLRKIYRVILTEGLWSRLKFSLIYEVIVSESSEKHISLYPIER